MSGTLAYIIPGADEDTIAPYHTLQEHFRECGMQARIVTVGWKYRTLSSYCRKFLGSVRGSNVHCILGFSLGAMAASVAATILNPASLILCSLSPYFKEDQSHLTGEDKASLGIRRIRDFGKYSFPEIAGRITSQTHVLAGLRESKVLIRRCEIAQHEIANASLTLINNAAHSLQHGSYREALRKIICL